MEVTYFLLWTMDMVLEVSLLSVTVSTLQIGVGRDHYFRDRDWHKMSGGNRSRIRIEKMQQKNFSVRGDHYQKK